MVKMKKIYSLITFLACGYLALGQNSGSVEPALNILAQFQKVRDFTINSDGSEAYFTMQSPLEEVAVIAVIRKSSESWTGPEIAQFSGQYRDLEPFLSPNGLRLYFVSNRPLEVSQNKVKDFDIWYVERSSPNSPWSKPVNPGAPVNTEHNEFYPAITNSGNLYITSDRPDSKGQDDIFFCEWLGDKYKEPTSISESINSDSYEFNAYVAPDESFLIFSGYNREDGYGSGDMYISYRNSNAEWEPAVNLGEDINSSYMEYCPYVDMGTKTLYFTSRRSAIEDINNIRFVEDFNKVVNVYENGNSRIYKVPFNPVSYRK